MNVTEQDLWWLMDAANSICGQSGNKTHQEKLHELHAKLTAPAASPRDAEDARIAAAFRDLSQRNYGDCYANLFIMHVREQAAAPSPATEQAGALLTNPHTGTPRDYRDVESDPAGILIPTPGEPLRAAAPVGADAVERVIASANANPNLTVAGGLRLLDGLPRIAATGWVVSASGADCRHLMIMVEADENAAALVNKKVTISLATTKAADHD